MKIIHTKLEMKSLALEACNRGDIIGLVPTMGALHDGHLTLVKRAVDDCSLVVVSLFVNPRQFNNPEDLKSYPRTPEEDAQKLEAVGVDYLFMPTAEDIYDDIEQEREFDFGRLDKVMEGTHRPGHFAGVAQVVSRLFDIVTPHRAYFGEKDFQQLAIIKNMVARYDYALEIVPIPIVRASSGLALSSRNLLLSEAERAIATNIYKTLLASRQLKEEKLLAPRDIEQYVVSTLNTIPELEVEYFEIVDADSLERLSSWQDASGAVGCIACYCGEVRLIDNIFYT